MNELALTGGPAVAARLQELAGAWPRPGDIEVAQAALASVLASGKWGRLHPESAAEQV